MSEKLDNTTQTLFEVCQSGDATKEEIESLFKLGAKVDETNKYGQNPAFVAIMSATHTSYKSAEDATKHFNHVLVDIVEPILKKNKDALYTYEESGRAAWEFCNDWNYDKREISNERDISDDGKTFSKQGYNTQHYLRTEYVMSKLSEMGINVWQPRGQKGDAVFEHLPAKAKAHIMHLYDKATQTQKSGDENADGLSATVANCAKSNNDAYEMDFEQSAKVDNISVDPKDADQKYEIDYAALAAITKKTQGRS